MQTFASAIKIYTRVLKLIGAPLIFPPKSFFFTKTLLLFVAGETGEEVKKTIENRSCVNSGVFSLKKTFQLKHENKKFFRFCIYFFAYEKYFEI